MSSSDASPNVTDDRVHHCLLFQKDGQVAHLDYREDGGRLTLIHTEVPDGLGGHGIGGLLVRAGVARAVRDNLTIVPWCSYARKWLQDHPDVASAASIDWEMAPPT
jgi:predicted GNAT family acetyltransferase